MGLITIAVRGAQVHRDRLSVLGGLAAVVAFAALTIPFTRDRVLRYPLDFGLFLAVVIGVVAFWTASSDFTKRMRKNPLSVIGFSIIALFIAVASLAPALAPPPATSRDPYLIPQEGFANDPQPPRSGHPFGTTQGQYDLYYGIIWGTRTAFRVAVLVVAITIVIGLVVGGLSGYYGGKMDEAMMRVTDVFLAFPGIVLAVTVVAVLGRA